MDTLSWDQFEAVDLRAGTIVAVDEFPEAHRPAYLITVDFGPELGLKKTSAQVTRLYSPQDLVGTQCLAVINFPPKQIGPLRSEFLLTGLPTTEGEVVLVVPERPVPNGTRLA